MTAAYLPGRTALHRSGPSTLARYTVEHKLTAGPIFDWGCGHGTDIGYFRNQGILAEGYDPYHRRVPGTDAYKPGLFPWVQCAFVLNVLEAADRVALLKRIFDFMPAGGTLAVAVRTSDEVARSRRAGWKPYADGYLTTRNTFQHGLTDNELYDLLVQAGFTDVKIVKDEPLFAIARKGK